MDYGQFLSEYEEDPRLRLKLWNLFQKAEEEAKRFPEKSGDWYEIVEVNCLPGQGGAWKWDDAHRQAFIQIVPRWDDLGTIFHEIFHSAFHNSLLHGKVGRAKEDYDQDWGDPFSEAFRYFMEKRLLKYVPSNWFDQMEKVCQMSFDQGLAEYAQDQELFKKYRYPGSLIIKRANKDYDVFHNLWCQLLSNKRFQIGYAMLNEYFCYDVQAGQPISKTAC